MREYFVYIMTNRSKTLYVGVTNNLLHRVHEHKQKLVPGFAARYNLTRLVYFETTNDAGSAIAREKQIKGWLRRKKIALIESVNPRWEDLSLAWVTNGPETLRSAQGDMSSAQRGTKEEAQGDMSSALGDSRANQSEVQG